MKRYLYLLILITLILFLGCTKITDWKPTEYEYVNNNDNIVMTVKEETVSPTGLTVMIENKSDNEFIYGEYFQLEKKIKGKWYQVPVIIESYGFDDVGYPLAPGEAREWSVDWGWLYGGLDAGEYRIVKTITGSGGKGDNNQYILAAEFKILSSENK